MLHVRPRTCGLHAPARTRPRGLRGAGSPEGARDERGVAWRPAWPCTFPGQRWSPVITRPFWQATLHQAPAHHLLAPAVPALPLLLLSEETSCLMPWRQKPWRRRRGLELAAELGLNKILLEVDCQALSNFLQGPQPFTSSIGGLCFDILELGKSFPSFSNRWIRRDANSVAHACASLVSAAERAFFWIDCIPNWLVMLAASDCTLAGN